jgi:microcystin-dependent protein
MEVIIGSIYLWPLDWAPQGFLLCQGQQVPIYQYQALYTILGITYGGDGKTVFNLPDLRCRVPLGVGQNANPSIPAYLLGKTGGEEAHSLTLNELPAHTHAGIVQSGATLSVNSGNATQSTATSGASIATGGKLSNSVFTPKLNYNTATPDQVLNSATITAADLGTITNTSTGGNMAHNNMQPFLVLNSIIAWDGDYPTFP